MDGEYKDWWENGKMMMQTTYKNNCPEGILKKWREDGSIELEYYYKDGEYHGDCKEWDKDYELTLHQCWYKGSVTTTYYKKPLTKKEKAKERKEKMLILIGIF